MRYERRSVVRPSREEFSADADFDRLTQQVIEHLSAMPPEDRIPFMRKAAADVGVNFDELLVKMRALVTQRRQRTRPPRRSRR
jgi:hypothetical protein